MNKIFVLLLVIPVFLAACCVPVEKKSEVSKTFKNDKKKVVCKYTGTGEDKTLIERITYNEAGKVT
ncbi:MAG: hypothetical protein GY757_44140, partial [bacterium]|nr:hypothetical protein [bacterium]